jgi:type II secretory pathway pseudopilin PulG
MADPQSITTPPAFYGVPLALWLTLLATVVVGILSAAAAIVVVWRSNANSRKNLREQLDRGGRQFGNQLEHDSRQLERKLEAEATERVREREMSLRREVYLEAASALIHLQTLLGQASNIAYNDKDLMAEFAKDQATIAKTHIVGSPETVAAVMSFVGDVGPAFLELLTRRAPLLIRKSAIETHSVLLGKAASERDRFIGMMKEYNLERSNDPARFKAIEKQHEFANSQWEYHDKIRQKLLGEQAKEQLTVAERVFELSRKILVTRLPDAVLAVRKEMEMPLDREFYEALWQEQTRKLDEAWRETKDRLAKIFKGDGSANAP